MTVLITITAQKQFNKIPLNEQKKIRKKFSILEKDKFAGKKLERELEGYRSLRAWPYRIIYSIDENRKELTIKYILHRQGTYKN